ncbi:unnamed protein product [Linum trigynum]|uniref:Uncharacterized protein n=1 Tax=Linum trigynum TaxID=586398 RepID=A0AAV2CKF0_9ROSI
MYARHRSDAGGRTPSDAGGRTPSDAGGRTPSDEGGSDPVRRRWADLVRLQADHPSPFPATTAHLRLRQGLAPAAYPSPQLHKRRGNRELGMRVKMVDEAS